MREFRGIQRIVRMNLAIYLFARRMAPFLCRYFALEEGFAILKVVVNDEYSLAVDVGSNDGTSIALITKYSPMARIQCFDPIREPKIPRKLRSQVSHSAIAIGSSSSEQEIFTPKIGRSVLTQYSSFDSQSLEAQLSHDLKIEPKRIKLQRSIAKIQTLDQQQLNIFFLKIDVEGGELQVLNGAIKTINRFRPIVLVEIQNDKVYEEIENFFAIISYENVSYKGLLGGKYRIEKRNGFSLKSNNYLWLPVAKSPSWEFRGHS